MIDPVAEIKGPHKYAKKALAITWMLVDAFHPPWIRAIGIGFCLIWIGCVSGRRRLITPDDETTRNMAYVFTDVTWGLTSLAVFIICTWSIYDFNNISKRNKALIALFSYWFGAAALLLVGLWNRPLGWIHFLFGVIALVAFFRPLIKDMINEVRIRLHLKKE